MVNLSGKDEGEDEDEDDDVETVSINVTDGERFVVIGTDDAVEQAAGINDIGSVDPIDDRLGDGLEDPFVRDEHGEDDEVKLLAVDVNASAVVDEEGDCCCC